MNKKGERTVILSDLTENQSGATDVLVKLGLTHMQAKIYLSMVGMEEKKKAQTISQAVGLDRSNTYQLLSQLQEMGLVEKILGKPSTYRAKQIQEGISSLLNNYEEHYDSIQKEASKLMKTMQPKCEGSDKLSADEYLSLTSGFKMSCAEYSKNLQNLQDSLDYICIDWKKVVNWFIRFEQDYLEALRRGVKIRCIAQIRRHEKMPPIVSEFLESGLFTIRSATTAAHAGIDIWDKERVHIIVYPGNNLNGLDVIKSSHSALIELAQDLFETKWKQAKPPCWQQDIEV